MVKIITNLFAVLCIYIDQKLNGKKIESIIKAYKIARAQNPDVWLSDCANAATLENAIELGATAKNSVGRKHSHQFRIPNIILDKFALAILAKAHRIAASADFHELISTIESCKIKGVSDLTVYDTAQRIGEYMNLYPNRI